MATGGSVVTITLAGSEFTGAADSDTQRKIGGVENEFQMNGNKTARQIQTLVAWQFGPYNVECDDLSDDQTTLQNLANRKSEFPITIEYASGAIYQGTGNIVGEINFSNTSTTIPLTLGGGNILTVQ
jgi:hypothetical protein